METTTADRTAYKSLARAVAVLAFALMVCVHCTFLGLTTNGLILHDRAPLWGDSGVKFYRAKSRLECYQETGRRLGYDARVLAGIPSGVVNSDSPLGDVWMLVLGSALGAARAFGLWVIFAFSALPLACLVGTRWLGASWTGSLLATAAFLLALHLDPLGAMMLRYGFAAFFLACAVVLIFTVAFQRLLDAPGPRRLLVMVPLLPFLGCHVLVPPTLVPVFLGLCGLRAVRRDADLKRAAGYACAFAALGLVTNLYWVWPLLAHYDLHGSTSQHLTASPSLLFSDLVNPLRLLTSEPPSSSLVGRWATLGLASIGAFAAFRRGGDAQIRAVGSLALGAFLVGYLGSLVSIGRDVQHARFLILALLAAATLTPAGVAVLWARFAGRHRSLLFAVAVVLIGCTAVYDAVKLAGRPLRPAELSAEGHAVLTYLTANATGEDGRILAESSDGMANAIPLIVDHPALTFGLPTYIVPHGLASWTVAPPVFLCRPYDQVRPEEVPERLARYNVTWVVSSTRNGRNLCDAVGTATLIPRAEIGRYRVYQVRQPAGWFIEGTGRLETRPGRLVLTQLTGPVTIRFHYWRGLFAKGLPEVAVERAPAGDDEAGFIRIDPQGHDQLTIEWRP